MTLLQRQTFEQHDPLRPEHFEDGKLTCEIVKAREISTKFKEDQIVIDVKVGVEIFSWWANDTSVNKLIDLHGNNELVWGGKKVDLELINQLISGKKKDVIYVQGCFDDES